MDLEFSIIDHNHPLYEKVLDLRNEILRIPLGMNLFDEDLNDDKEQYVLIACRDKNLVACLMLKVIDKNTVKLRQMAVDNTEQGRGTGSGLVHFAENFCLLNGYSRIELHARRSAMGFYLKLNFKIDGEEFPEVGIPHFKMIKDQGQY